MKNKLLVQLSIETYFRLLIKRRIGHDYDFKMNKIFVSKIYKHIALCINIDISHDIDFIRITP